MKLSLVLFALGLKMLLKSIFSSSFRKLVRGRKYVLVIRTRDGRTARTFYVRNGFILSRRGASKSADTELVWLDGETAVRAMLSQNELDVYSALGSGKLQIAGNLSFALDFMDVAK